MSFEIDSRVTLAATAMAVALAAGPVVARAAEETTTLSADAAGRYGPAGMTLVVGGARRWTEADGASALERGRYAEVGASVGINPAWTQGSLAAEWVPFAILQLKLGYDLFGFFGANGSLLRLPSKDSKFGKEELNALAGSEGAGIGHRVTFSPVLRARLGPVVLRNETDLERYALSAAPGWYYESENDTVVARSDWVVVNRSILFANLSEGPSGTTLLVGPMYDVTRSGAAAVARQRVGAALYLARAVRKLGFDRMRLYAIGGVNLSDRNRTGEPFAALGLGGDLDVR
jgi:hypothetical protein